MSMPALTAARSCARGGGLERPPSGRSAGASTGPAAGSNGGRCAATAAGGAGGAGGAEAPRAEVVWASAAHQACGAGGWGGDAGSRDTSSANPFGASASLELRGGRPAPPDAPACSYTASTSGIGKIVRPHTATGGLPRVGTHPPADTVRAFVVKSAAAPVPPRLAPGEQLILGNSPGPIG